MYHNAITNLKFLTIDMIGKTFQEIGFGFEPT